MKIKKLKEELRQATVSDMYEKLEQFRQELFGLRLNKYTGHVKDYSQFRQLRNNIARVLTVIKEREKVNNELRTRD